VKGPLSSACAKVESVGCIHSWDDHRWDFPRIVDNMMNQALLFWTAQWTGSPGIWQMG